MSESWMTVCEVEDRLIDLGFGRLIDGVNDFGRFISGDVAIGLSDRGFCVHVYDRKNLKVVREAFRDAPQVQVMKTSRAKPLG